MFGGKLDTKNPKEKKLKDFLSTYGVFYLHFNHNEKNYEIKKDFSSPKFYINDVEIAQKDYTEELNKIFFEENSNFHLDKYSTLLQDDLEEIIIVIQYDNKECL